MLIVLKWFNVGHCRHWMQYLEREDLHDVKSTSYPKLLPRGSFSFAVELENLFGFCEDYDEVVYGMRHKLTLVRKNNDDAIQRITVAGAGKVELTKVAWVMPRVHPSDVKKFSLYKTIKSKVVLDAAFQMQQCSSAEIPPQTQSFDWRLGVRTAPENPPIVRVSTRQIG